MVEKLKAKVLLVDDSQTSGDKGSEGQYRHQG